MDFLAQWIVANPEGAAVLAGVLVAGLMQLLKKRFPKVFPAGSAAGYKIATSAVLALVVTWAKAQVAGQPFSWMDALVTMAASTLAHAAVPGMRSEASKTPGKLCPPDEADGP